MEEETKCKHGVPGNCLTCYNESISPSDKTWEERFDAEIEKITDIYYGDDGYKKLGKYLQSNENRLFEEQTFPETFFELSPEKVKSFIQQELTSATIKAKEEVLREMLKGFEKPVINDKFIIQIDSIMEQFIKGFAKEQGINLE